MSRVTAEKIEKPGKDSLRLQFGRHKNATGVFTVHRFQDHEHTVAYIPSLNLSAYGDSHEEALDRLVKEVLDDFFENILDLSPEQANHELEKLGWSRSKLFKKQFKSNSFVDRNGVLKNFNLPEETKVETTVVTV